MCAVKSLYTTDVADVEERLDKIKSTGYWYVNIHPIQFEKQKIESPERCWEIVESCRVFLRGWDYPVINERERVLGEDWVQSGADFMGIVEIWRFYQSGQFVHYFSCLEDYRMKPDEYKSNKFDRALSFTSTLYRITEIFEFATRLALKNVLENGVSISIKLLGMKGRGLYEPERSVVWEYISDHDEIAVESNLSTINLIASSYNEAIDKALEIYSNFGLVSYPRSLLVEEQRRFLGR